MKSNIIKEYLDKELEVTPFSPGKESMQKLSAALDMRRSRRRLLRSVIITAPALLLTSLFLIPAEEMHDVTVADVQNTSGQIATHQSVERVTASDKSPEGESVSPFSESERESRNDLANQETFESPGSPSATEVSSKTGQTTGSEVSEMQKDSDVESVPAISALTNSGVNEAAIESAEPAKAVDINAEVALEAMPADSSHAPENISEADLKDILPRLSAIAFAGPQWATPVYSGDATGIARSEGMTSLNAGINMTYRLNKGLHLQSGLNYYSIADQIIVPESTDSAMEVIDNGYWDVTDGWKTVYDTVWDDRNPGNWLYIDSMVVPFKDSVYRPDYDTAYNSTSKPSQRYVRKISQVEIPLLLYIEKSWKKFSVGILAGAGIGYVVYSTGNIITSDGQAETLSSGEYIRKWNLSLLGGLCFDYRFAPSWSAGFLPMIRIPAGPIIESDAAGISYTTYSANLRLRYFFNLPKSMPR